MRAAIRQRYGGPDVIRLTDLPDPSPAPGELLVRVHATTVSRTDCAYRSGKPWVNRLVCGWPRPRVHVLGAEFAGVVVSLGEGVATFAPGDRVVGFVDGRPGAHAELLTVPAGGMLARAPAALEPVDVAPTMEGGHYAHACLRVTGASRGDRALVHGATGAIGSALVQLLHAEGVRVTAVCDRLPPDRPGLLEALGADRVVDLQSVGLSAAGDGFDVVVDATGHLPFAHARALLRPGGAYVSSDLGRGGQNLARAAVGRVAKALGWRHVRFPLPRASATLAVHLRDLVADGRYRPVVDRTYDLEELAEAHAYVDSGRKVGSVVITMPEASSQQS